MCEYIGDVILFQLTMISMTLQLFTVLKREFARRIEYLSFSIFDYYFKMSLFIIWDYVCI